MRVEAAERDVEDPRRHVRDDHLRDEPQRLAQGERRILHGRLDVADDGLHPPRKRVGLVARALDEVEGTDARRLDFVELLDALLERAGSRHFQQRGIRQRGRPGAVARKGERGLLPESQAEHRTRDALAFGVEIASDPARLPDPLGRRGGLPDVRRPKVRAGRIGVADVRHERQPPVLKQLLQLDHLRMQAEVIVELEHLLGRDADPRTQLVIVIVGVRNQRVEAVVAASQLQDDQDVVVLEPRQRLDLRDGTGPASATPVLCKNEGTVAVSAVSPAKRRILDDRF